MIDVGALESFKERTGRVVSVGGTEVGIFRWEGDQVYAVRNVCPHAGAPLCRGRFGPQIVDVEGRPGSMAVDEGRPVIACSWHGWEFDVRTGSAVVTGSRYKVRTYSVRVEDGRVLVDVQRRKREAGSMGS